MSNTPINLEWMLSQDEDTVELTCPLSELEHEIPPGLDVDSLFNESLVPENTYELNMDGSNGDDNPFEVHCRQFHSERCDGYTHVYLCAAPVRGERSQDMLFCTLGEQCPIYVAQQIEERLEASSSAIPDPHPPSTPEWACEDAGFFKDLDIDQIIACCTDATAPTSTEKINEIIPVEVAIGDPLQHQHATTSSGIQSTIAPIDQNYQFDDSSIQKIFISHDLQPITQAELEAVLSALHGISETLTPCPLPPSPPSQESSSAKKRRAPSSHDQPPQKRNRVEILHQIGGREPQPGSSGLQQVLGIVCMACASPAYLQGTHWFLFVATISFITTLIWVFVYFLSIREALKLPINWILTELFNTGVDTILYVIAFIVQLAIWTEYYHRYYRGVNIAAGVFGIFNAIAYGAGTYFLFVEWKGTRTAN